MVQSQVAAVEFRKPAIAQAINFKNAQETPKSRTTPQEKTPPAMTVQQQIAVREFRKPAATQSVKSQITPDGQAGGVKSSTKTSGGDSPPAKTPIVPAAPPDNALLFVLVQPPVAAWELHKPASTQAVNFKNAAVAQTDEAKSSSDGASMTKTTPPLAAPSDITLLSVLVQPQVAAGELRKPAPSQTVNSKIGPAAPEGKPRPSIKTPSSDTSATETSTPLAAPLNNALLSVPARPQIAAGELREPASTQIVNSKIVPAAPEGKPLPSTKTSSSDTSATETPTPLAAPLNNALLSVPVRPQIAAGESREPASTQAVNSKIVPAAPEGKPLPSTKTSSSDTSATETPTPLVAPLNNALLSVPTRPQIGAGELREPASTQAVNSKIVPVGQKAGPQSFTKTSSSDVPISSTLTTVIAQPKVAAASETGKGSVMARSSSDSKPESAGPVPKTIDPMPSEKPVLTKEPAEAAGSSLQPVPAQIAITPQMGLVPVDGTGGALNSQRMNLSRQKNEIAGPTAQKVPTASPKDDFAIKAASDVAGASDSDHSGHKQDTMNSGLVMDLPAKASELYLDAGKGTGAAHSVDHTATLAERVGHLVNQQVVMIRQSGANNLAVSLKLDSRTELSLQLTNHNGQIEASVRWERGNVAGLDNHWKDLQDSLARQNVQLLPLENKTASRTPAFNSAADAESASSFKQSSQNPQRHSREARQELPLATGVQAVPARDKTTTRTSSRQGWESWA